MSKYPYGKVVSHKILDGIDIGIVLQLKNGRNFWFFTHEILEALSEENQQDLQISRTNDTYEILQSSNKLSFVLNPLNFFKWLSISFKDVL